MTPELESGLWPRFKDGARRLRHGAITRTTTLRNRLSYGEGAPRGDDVIHVDPRSVTFHYCERPDEGAPVLPRPVSCGRVLDGDWDRSVRRVTRTSKYKACRAHFVDGVPWEETGIYDRIMAHIERNGFWDQCRSREDVVARYAALDGLYEVTRLAGRLPPVTQLRAGDMGSQGHIFGHMARDGSILRCREGNHRFAIAHILGLPSVPIRLGAVHVDAARAGLVAPLRTRP